MLGAKTIEAGTCALGHRNIAHAGEEMFLIETPGSKSRTSAVVDDLLIGPPPDDAQVIGTVSFKSSNEYTCLSAWRHDRCKHRTKEGRQYDWIGTGKMHAWCAGQVQFVFFNQWPQAARAKWGTARRGHWKSQRYPQTAPQSKQPRAWVNANTSV